MKKQQLLTEKISIFLGSEIEGNTIANVEFRDVTKLCKKNSKIRTYKKGDKYGTNEVIKTFKTGAFISQGKGGWKSLIIPNPYNGFWCIKTLRDISELTKFHNGHINKNNWEK